MTKDTWLDIIARISTDGPVDLDTLIFDTVEPHQIDRDMGPIGAGIPPSTRLWHGPDSAQSYIGIRVEKPPADAPRVALRLAAAALERGVTPIILSTLAESGFERFGFRVERLIAGNADALKAQEKELIQFWDLAIVIDVSQVAGLG